MASATCASFDPLEFSFKPPELKHNTFQSDEKKQYESVDADVEIPQKFDESDEKKQYESDEFYDCEAESESDSEPDDDRARKYCSGIDDPIVKAALRGDFQEELRLTSHIDSYVYIHSEDDDIDSEDDDEIDSEDDDESFAQYHEQVSKSEGFDVDKFPTLLRSFFGIINPLDNLQNDRNLLKVVKKCSKLAIHKYNTDNETNYGSVKVSKANAKLVAGFIYYITFRAKNADDGKTETFQSEVWDRIMKEPKVEFCRIKPSA